MTDITTSGKPPPVPIPPGDAPAFPSRGHILSYVRGTWGKVPDPCGPDPGGEFTEEMYEAGYSLLHVHGVEDGPLWLEVFDHINDGTHVVVINTASKFHPILVPDVPSLMGLLRELLPVIEAAQRLDEVQERDERRRRLRKQGPTRYNARKRCMEYGEVMS